VTAQPVRIPRRKPAPGFVVRRPSGPARRSPPACAGAPTCLASGEAPSRIRRPWPSLSAPLLRLAPAALCGHLEPAEGRPSSGASPSGLLQHALAAFGRPLTLALCLACLGGIHRSGWPGWAGRPAFDSHRARSHPGWLRGALPACAFRSPPSRSIDAQALPLPSTACCPGFLRAAFQPCGQRHLPVSAQGRHASNSSLASASSGQPPGKSPVRAGNSPDNWRVTHKSLRLSAEPPRPPSGGPPAFASYPAPMLAGRLRCLPPLSAPSTGAFFPWARGRRPPRHLPSAPAIHA